MKQQTKEKIIDVVLQLCQKQSVWSIKIDDIVRHSHISRATFYNYFKSKDDLIFTLFENALDKAQQDIISAVNQNDDIKKVLKNYLRQTIFFLIEFAQTLNIHIEEIQFLPSIPKKRMEAKQEKDIGIIRDFIQRGIDSGEFIVNDLDMTAHMIFMIISEIGKIAILENRDTERVEYDIDAFLKLLFYVITGASEGLQKQHHHHHSQTDSRHAHLYDHDSGTD